MCKRGSHERCIALLSKSCDCPAHCDGPAKHIEALKTIKAIIEEPSNDPKNRNDMTTHRMNGVIAHIYATACEALR